MPDDMAMPAAPPAAPEGGDERQHLAALITSLLASDTPEAHDKIKKILAVFKPDAPEPMPEAEEEPPKKSDKEKAVYEDDEDEDEEKKMKESAEKQQLIAENTLLKRKMSVLAEARELRVELSEASEKALVALEDPADRRALLEEFRNRKTYANYAKSVGPAPVNNDVDFEKTYASTMQRLTGRSVKR